MDGTNLEIKLNKKYKFKIVTTTSKKPLNVCGMYSVISESNILIDGRGISYKDIQDMIKEDTITIRVKELILLVDGNYVIIPHKSL